MEVTLRWSLSSVVEVVVQAARRVPGTACAEPHGGSTTPGWSHVESNGRLLPVGGGASECSDCGRLGCGWASSLIRIDVDELDEIAAQVINATDDDATDNDVLDEIAAVVEQWVAKAIDQLWAEVDSEAADLLDEVCEQVRDRVTRTAAEVAAALARGMTVEQAADEVGLPMTRGEQGEQAGVYVDGEVRVWELDPIDPTDEPLETVVV